MPAPPRILVITAAFGEGHNSAAKNLGIALNSLGADAKVCDPCISSAPRITGALCAGYRMVTTHAPLIWHRIYQSTDRWDLSKHRAPVMKFPERELLRLIREFKPAAVVSTYPLYPYFIAEYGMPEIPVFTVVTDSIEINAAWLRAPSDFWLVTDPGTREGMIRKGLAAEKVVDTGFPVNPSFAELSPVDPADGCDPFRVLYFPTAKRSLLRSQGRALLDASPTLRLTLVLGRNVRFLYHEAKSLKSAYPGRVRIIGWTRKVPLLLNSHHLVVGKAGGATVHEAIAARCPMLIHHLVPGQEEGNLRLLEAIGGGGLADSPESLAGRVTDLLSDHAAGWRSMKQALARHGRNAGAIAAARFVLNQIGDRGSKIAD